MSDRLESEICKGYYLHVSARIYGETGGDVRLSDSYRDT
jgi:hypothetical protein